MFDGNGVVVRTALIMASIFQCYFWIHVKRHVIYSHGSIYITTMPDAWYVLRNRCIRSLLDTIFQINLLKIIDFLATFFFFLWGGIPKGLF